MLICTGPLLRTMTLADELDKLIQTNASFRGTSPFLMIAGIGTDMGVSQETMCQAMEQRGCDIQEILLLPTKVVIRCSTEEAATRTRALLHMQTLPNLPPHKMFVRYAVINTVCAIEPSCISATYGVEVPGLTILSEFISPEDEVALLQALDVEERWDSTAVARRVQHFGYSLDFRARDIDLSCPVPPIPPLAQIILDRVMAARLLPHRPNQMTVNEYAPGQGISPHVDVHTCFEDGFMFLTLSSGIVMDFRAEKGGKSFHRAHWLSPRSIACLTGEARYVWTHGIASRKSDKVDGRIIPRGRRISLSFRTILQSPSCKCDFPNACDDKARG